MPKVDGGQLYKTFLGPFFKDFERANELVIVTDGQLNTMPFELLITDFDGAEASFKDLDYLVYEISVQYQFSSQIQFEKTAELRGKQNALSPNFKLYYVSVKQS